MYDTPLDEAMNTRRLELRMRWKDVAKDAHLSTGGLREIRSGEVSPSQLTQRAIEDALAWSYGSIAAITRGEQPSAIAPATWAQHRAQQLLQRDYSYEEMVPELAAALWRMGHENEEALRLAREIARNVHGTQSWPSVRADKEESISADPEALRRELKEILEQNREAQERIEQLLRAIGE